MSAFLLSWIRRDPLTDFRPLQFHGAEMLVMRALFAWLIFTTFPKNIPWAAQPHPVGIANWINLTFLGEPGMSGLLKFTLATALVFYIAGQGMRGALVLMTAIYVAVFTLKNSQGGIGHVSQIVSMALLAQLVIHWVPSFAPKTWQRWKGTGLTIHQVGIYATQVVIAGVYVTAGCVKLINSEGRWIWDSPKLAVQLIKTHDQGYYNGLQNDELSARGLAIAEWLVANPNLARIFLGSGLVLELCAFLALWNRRWGALIGLSLIGMHLGIEMMMQLTFRNNQYMVLIFLVNVPFWIFWMGRAIAGAVKSPIGGLPSSA